MTTVRRRTPAAFLALAVPPSARAAGLRFAAFLALAVALPTLAACNFGEPDPDVAGEPPRFPTPSVTRSSAALPDQPLVTTPVASGLRVPWGVAFLPDGTGLVTERDSGKILKVGPESGPRGLKVTTVQTVSEVDARGEGGLMGIAVSPNYKTDKLVFIYYTASNDNRIAQLTLGGKPKPIVTGIPISGIHNGGRLAFGPDGYLYATTGDASQRGLAQDKASLGGKILRMTPDGKPAPGNPFPNSLVWSYGHRNVQGIAWDAGKRLFATEFGSTSWDEINRIEKGRNYGWPVVEGKGGGGKYVEPLVVWRVAESSCSGAAVLGRLLIAACLRGERLWAMELTDTGSLFGQPRPLLRGKFGRLRTTVVAPDGSLWFTTSNHDGRGEPKPEDDRILRLVVPGGGGVGKS